MVADLRQPAVLYRVYPDGEVVHQDDFAEYPEGSGDDYFLVKVPAVVVEYIEDNMQEGEQHA